MPSIGALGDFWDGDYIQDCRLPSLETIYEMEVPMVKCIGVAKMHLDSVEE